MKVLLISHTCQSRTEGQPKAVELARLGIELRVVVPRRWKHYGRWRFPDRPVSGAGFGLSVMQTRLAWCGPAQSYLHFYPGLGRVMREFQPDIIDLWEEPWSAVSLQACLLRERLCPRAAIISETEQNIDKTLPPPFEPMRSFVLRRADWVVGRNEESLDIVRRKGFTGRARVVPNAVDADLFCPLSPAKRGEVRGELGWRDDEFVAGYIGRLVEEKGLADFVEAVALCGPKVRAVLVGEGPFEAELRARIGQLGLEERVSILAARPLPRLAPLMGALDVLVLPSRTTARWKEQFGRVLIEAGACSVAVLGSDSGAIPDVVGQGGRVFPEGDAPALARHLDDLCAHPDEARALGQAGLRAVHQHTTWTRVAEAMNAIYRELCPNA
jgi:glycosyltransferase involved in cell wall biosynthesis